MRHIFLILLCLLAFQIRLMGQPDSAQISLGFGLGLTSLMKGSIIPDGSKIGYRANVFANYGVLDNIFMLSTGIGLVQAECSSVTNNSGKRLTSAYSKRVKADQEYVYLEIPFSIKKAWSESNSKKIYFNYIPIIDIGIKLQFPLHTNSTFEIVTTETNPWSGSVYSSKKSGDLRLSPTSGFIGLGLQDRKERMSLAYQLTIISSITKDTSSDWIFSYLNTITLNYYFHIR